MRLTSLLLENYGCFAEICLSFDATPGHINLVVGPNGAGKTVLRGAFRDLLFGIPAQTAMAFRFGYPGMRIVAQGLDEDGVAFAISRRKGVGNTLVDAAGNSLDPIAIRRLIGDADEQLLKRLFALDTSLLRKGAEAMLASGGDLAEALFAGSGIAGLRRVRRQFEAARDELAPARRAAGRPLYRALNELGAARSALRQVTARPQVWRQLNEELAFVCDRKTSLAAEQARGQEKIERLQRVKRVRPWLEQLASARRQCAVSANAPRLAADIEDRWQEARQAAALCRRELATEADRARALAARLEVELPGPGMLAERTRIEDLERARDKIAADHRDLPRREVERRQTAERLAALLDELSAASAEDVSVISATGPQIAAARELAKRQGVLSQMQQTAATKASDGEREITTIEGALALLHEPEDTTPLAALVDEIQVDGDPPRRLAELIRKLDQQQSRLAAALARLPLWREGQAELAALVPPTRGMIDRAADALAAAGGTLAEAEHEVARLHAEHRAATQRLARERSGKPVPDATAVAAARSHRDLGWALIRRSRFEGEAVDAEIAAYAGVQGLSAAFERAVGAADDLADRRDEEGQRLASIAEQQRRVAGLDETIAGAERRRAQAAAASEDAGRSWAALTSGLGLADPPNPADMRDFIAAREAALDALADRDCAARAVAAEVERQEAARQRLARLLPEVEPGSLGQALAAARRLIEQGAAGRQRRQQLQERLDTFRRLCRLAADERDNAERLLADWNTAWRACLAALRRPSGEMPAGAEKAIELIEEARRVRDKLAELDHRIAGMKRNIAEFDACVAGLVATLAPDLRDQSTEAAADELRRRLAKNLEIEARRGLLGNQLREATARQEDAAIRQNAAEATLEALRQEIGGGCDPEIADRMALARRRTEAEAKLREVEAELAAIGEGWSVEKLQCEAAALPADEVEIELARLRDDDRRIGSEREIAAGEEVRLSEELRRIGAGEGAIEAAQRRQAALAAVARISGDALLYHAASCLLQRAIERLREIGERGVVDRIGSTFASLTGNAFAGISIDEDDKGAPCLVAVAADRRTSKRIGELSEGECDQLYLAMRLVMVADYASKAPPLPFIADDLLQTFDDYGRTQHALAAFAELSNKAQVILFSHHRQLAEAARSLLPTDVVNVCELAA